MNMNLKLSINPKQLLGLIKKSQGFLVLVAVIAICGYTAYQISLVVAIAPDKATIEAEKKTAEDTSVKFDMKTISAITQQTNVAVSPNLSGIGTSNPFFP